MLVRAKEMCFHDGSRRRPGDVFEWKVKHIPSYVEVVAAVEAVEVKAPAGDRYAHLNDDELRVKLADVGIKTPPTAKRETLLKKLAALEGRE
jgi:hypothetical protein